MNGFQTTTHGFNSFGFTTVGRMDGTRNPDLPDIILIDHPENHCFGCSPHNARGLKLVWQRNGDGVVSHYTSAEHLCGAPGVIHGGVQAALLDETIGVAIHHAFGDPDNFFLVTATFDLKYKRPAPTGEQLVLSGRFERQEGRNYFASGEIRNREGALLTSASARWVQMKLPETKSGQLLNRRASS